MALYVDDRVPTLGGQIGVFIPRAYIASALLEESIVFLCLYRLCRRVQVLLPKHGMRYTPTPSQAEPLQLDNAYATSTSTSSSSSSSIPTSLLLSGPNEGAVDEEDEDEEVGGGGGGRRERRRDVGGNEGARQEEARPHPRRAQHGVDVRTEAHGADVYVGGNGHGDDDDHIRAYPHHHITSSLHSHQHPYFNNFPPTSSASFPVNESAASTFTPSSSSSSSSSLSSSSSSSATAAGGAFDDRPWTARFCSRLQRLEVSHPVDMVSQ